MSADSEKETKDRLKAEPICNKKVKDLQVSTSKTNTKAQAPVVEAQNGQAVTTTLDVARYFRKRHLNVVRAVEKLRAESSADHLLNFESMVIDVRIGSGATRQVAAYQLTCDGFVMLVMGFTGQRAKDFKWAYIDAFNTMEAKLREDRLWVGGLSQALERICPTPPVEAPSVRSQRAIKTLRALAAYWAMIEEIPPAAAETAVCAVGKIRALDDFDFDRFEDEFSAMNDFLERAIALSSAKDKQPASEQQINTIKYLVDACSQFRYSRDRNIYELLREDYGISVETILTASSGQAKRIAATVYTLLRRHNMQTLVINEIKRRAKKADDKKQLPKGGNEQ